MMLVHHDLDAFFLGDLPLADVAVVERRAFFGIVVAVGKVDADRFELVRRGKVGISGLGEVPGPHEIFS
jgi:hypothetical protein